MLQKIVILTVFACSQALPTFILEDEDQQYALIPMHRVIRRETVWDIAKLPNGGTNIKVGHEGMIDLGNSNHQLTAGGFANKQFDPKGPTTLGGTVNYKNIPTGTSIKAEVSKTPVWGTDVNVQGSKTFFENGGAKFEAVGGFQQHFRGLPGTQKADPMIGLKFQYVPNIVPNNIFKKLCKENGGADTNCAR